MSLSFRQSDILEIARTEQRVTVDGLSEHFDVTPQTIRRDLTELAEAGLLERVHGGAVLRSGVANIGYQDRRNLHQDAKARIARVCAMEIPDGASVFLGIGTTTEAVAQELQGHRSLLVVTNNLNVAQLLITHDSTEVILAGGALRQSDGGLVGPLAVATIDQFRFDHAVIGCSALDSSGELLDFDVQEVQVSQAVITRARHTCLVADHSKFSRTAPARVASLAELAAFCTDRPIDAALRKRCKDWKTRLVYADARQGSGA